MQVDAAEEWLTALDAEPSALLAWLRKQRNYGKLGFYFAALLEYWARFCPVLGTTGTTTWGFLPGGRLCRRASTTSAGLTVRIGEWDGNQA